MKHVSDIEALVRTLLESVLFHSLVIQSPPGWGKTTTVNRALKSLNQTAISIGSYSTPLALFQALCNHSSGLLLLDDCAGVFSDTTAMALLKSATWPGNNGERSVTWASTTEKLSQNSVVFTGKLVLLTNQMPVGHAVHSLLSRSLFYRFSFTASEAKELLLEAAASKENPTAAQVSAFLGEHVEKSGAEQISFRTFELGCELARLHPENWKELLLSLLPASGPSALVSDLAKSGASVRNQCEEFQKRTGLSARTFYNYRAKVNHVTQTE